MKVTFFSRVFLVASIMVGLLFAWDACLAQNTDISIKGGACYSCGEDPCDWHDVDCEAQPGETCGKKAACCRGPNTGDGMCTPVRDPNLGRLKQCVYQGCQTRGDEVCTGE